MAVTKRILRNGTTQYFGLTTDTKPTLDANSVGDTYANCDDTAKTVTEIWGWTGTQWVKY